VPLSSYLNTNVWHSLFCSTIPKKNSNGYTASLTCVDDDPYDMHPIQNASIKAILVPLLPPAYAKECA
jgi:hypothetical protein